MDLPHIDIILGQEWLFRKDPIISFRRHTVELEHNGSLHKLAGEKGLSNFPIVTLDDDQPTPRWLSCRRHQVHGRERALKLADPGH